MLLGIQFSYVLTVFITSGCTWILRSDLRVRRDGIGSIGELSEIHLQPTFSPSLR